MRPLSVALKPMLAVGAETIGIHMEWEPSTSNKGDAVFSHILRRAHVPSAQYTASDIQLRQGVEGKMIPLRSEDEKTRRIFFLEDDMLPGSLAIAKFQVRPRKVDAFTKCGPQTALETEDCGMSAAGMAFLLIPVLQTGDEVKETYHIDLIWDLSVCPPGTRAACTFGEGSHITAEVKPSVLEECYFMVGSVKSYPPPQASGPFGFYWLDEPDFDARKIGAQLDAIVPQMANFFGDADDNFRVFLRRNMYKCASGRGLHRGFVFAWNRIAPRNPDLVAEFLFHELVHNWPRMGLLTGDMGDFKDGWFNEGIADYYSVVLPYRFGVFSEDEFVRRMNLRLSGYYTNPQRGCPNKDVFGNFWSSHAFEKVWYQRGFMYFLQLNDKLHKARKRSLDDLVRDMVDLRQRDEKYHIRVWLAMVHAEIGDEAERDYDIMDQGLIVPPDDCLGSLIEGAERRWKLQREDQEEFDLGFEEASLSNAPRVVQGLDPESRAARAGVRNGDEITQRFSYFFDASIWGHSFSMTVRREGDVGDQFTTLEWIPRRTTKVESYKFVAM